MMGLVSTIYRGVSTIYRGVAHCVQHAVVGRAPLPVLPLSRDHTRAIRRRNVPGGLVYLSLRDMICEMYHVAWLTAVQFPVMIAALVLLLLVQALYLCIYGMEKCGVWPLEYSNELVRGVEEMSFVPNYFTPNPTVRRLPAVRRLPQRLWEGLAGIARGYSD